MSDNPEFSSDLLRPARDFEDLDVFPAELNAHGSYSTERFVLRLSPKVHALVDSLDRSGIVAASEVSRELIQAYSTFLHETVHWWQHKGSTSGLILSLQYPGVTYQNHHIIKEVLKTRGPIKSFKTWTQTAALSGISDKELANENSCVNNAIDAEFFVSLTLSPPIIKTLQSDIYFESVGHCYWIAYAQSTLLIANVCDPTFTVIPDARKWEAGFAAIREAGVEGFVRGGEVKVAPIGLRALYEGQARIAQLQYLAGSLEAPPPLAVWREHKMLDGIYGEAF